jgi:hypothetical protein
MALFVIGDASRRLINRRREKTGESTIVGEVEPIKEPSPEGTESSDESAQRDEE